MSVASVFKTVGYFIAACVAYVVLAFVLPERVAEFQTSIIVFGVIAAIATLGSLLFQRKYGENPFGNEDLTGRTGVVILFSVLALLVMPFIGVFTVSGPLILIFPSLTTTAIWVVIGVAVVNMLIGSLWSWTVNGNQLAKLEEKLGRRWITMSIIVSIVVLLPFAVGIIFYGIIHQSFWSAYFASWIAVACGIGIVIPIIVITVIVMLVRSRSDDGATVGVTDGEDTDTADAEPIQAEAADIETADTEAHIETAEPAESSEDSENPKQS